MKRAGRAHESSPRGSEGSTRRALLLYFRRCEPTQPPVRAASQDAVRGADRRDAGGNVSPLRRRSGRRAGDLHPEGLAGHRRDPEARGHRPRRVVHGEPLGDPRSQELPDLLPAQPGRVRPADALRPGEHAALAGRAVHQHELLCRQPEEHRGQLRLPRRALPVLHGSDDDVLERLVGRPGDVARRRPGQQVRPDPEPARAAAAAYPGDGVRLGLLPQARRLARLPDHRLHGVAAPVRVCARPEREGDRGRAGDPPAGGLPEHARRVRRGHVHRLLRARGIAVLGRAFSQGEAVPEAGRRGDDPDHAVQPVRPAGTAGP